MAGRGRAWVLSSLIGMAGGALAWNPLPPIPSTEGLEAAERSIFQRVNEERLRAKLPPLTLDARLSAAARLHARDMSERQYFSHTSPKPGFATPTDRIHRAGALDWGAAENIAFNEEAVGAVGGTLMTQWMNSPPHRENILTRAYTHIGVGVYRDARGRSYGVQEFVERPFEVGLEATQRTLKLQSLEWRGQVSGRRDLALFRGSEFVSALRLDAQGNFLVSAPWEPNQSWGIGSRAPGSQGAYLIGASVQTRSNFQAGAISVQTTPDLPLSASSAALTERQQNSTVLEMRFSGTRIAGNAALVVVLQVVNGQELRVPVRNAAASIVCPVAPGSGSPERRAVRLGLGADQYTLTHRFVLDCQSGQVIPGG